MHVVPRGPKHSLLKCLPFVAHICGGGAQIQSWHLRVSSPHRPHHTFKHEGHQAGKDADARQQLEALGIGGASSRLRILADGVHKLQCGRQGRVMMQPKCPWCGSKLTFWMSPESLAGLVWRRLRSAGVGRHCQTSSTVAWHVQNHVHHSASGAAWPTRSHKLRIAKTVLPKI